MSEPTPPDSPGVSWGKLCNRFAEVFSAQSYGHTGIVLAVSGGADSVALARLVVQVWQDSGHADPNLITLAHFNHKLRGQASDDDQAFVVQLAAGLGISVVTGSRENGIEAATDEATLRDQRYNFLRRTIAARGARCVVTAHNADDQIETVLHHLFRGTGPVGMCGIPMHRELDRDFMLVRPLIGFRGQQLRDALREIDQPWREDHTNAQSDYSRNWIRHELLPLIRTRYRWADDAILRLIDAQSGWHQLIADEAECWSDSHVAVVGDRVYVRPGPVQAAIVGLAITSLWDRMGWPRRDLSATHHRAIHALITGKSKQAITLPGDIHGSVDCDTRGDSRVCFRRADRRVG
jgi:tRNA(Ile)-lysidine synthase